jgi:hypothetical protein
MLRSFGRFSIRRERGYPGQPPLPKGTPGPEPTVKKSKIHRLLESAFSARNAAIEKKQKDQRRRENSARARWEYALKKMQRKNED